MKTNAAIGAPARRPSSPFSTAPTAKPLVFIVDDDVSVRESLELLIAKAGWRAEAFASAEEFLVRSRESVPSCLVLDVGLPDLNGLELQRRMSSRPELPIIFITGRGDIPMTVQAMRAGAVEFLTKPFSTEALLSAIHGAIERSRASLAQEAGLRKLRDRHEALTARERQVMATVVRGHLNKQIAFELGLSEITVKVHRGRVMKKMGATSLADLVNMSARLGDTTAGTR